MAALSTAVHFSDVDGEKIYSVTNSNEIGKITITFKGKHVSIYNISDHKLMHCWSVGHSVQLTSAAVYDTHTSNYICGTNHKELRLWPADEMNFDHSKKRKTNKVIRNIFPVADREPVLVTSDLTVCPLSSVKDITTYPSHMTPGESLLWCDAGVPLSYQTSAHTYIVALIGDPKRRVTRLCCVSITREGEVSENSIRHEFSDPTDKFISASLVTTEGSLHVYTLWAGGALQLTNFDTTNNHWSSGVQYTLASRKPHDMAIVGLDSSQVAVAGVNYQETEGVAIYNVKFGSMSCFQPYLHPHSGPVKVFHVSHHLLVICDQHLYTYTLTLQPSTLLSSLGSVTQEATLTRSLSLVNWTDSTEQVDTDQISQLFHKLLDHKQMKQATFESGLIELVTSLQADHLQHIWCSQAMVTVINKSLTHPQLWSITAIAHLVSQAHLPTSCVPGLFEALMKHKERKLLLKALSTVNDVPETVLVKVIGHILSLDRRSKKGSESMEVDKESLCPLTRDKTLFINTILRLPYNDVFLLDALHSLTFTHVLTLLNYLHHLMVTDDVTLKESQNSDQMKAENVVDWLCLLIDAHVTQLILSPDARHILVKLHQMVVSQVEFYNSLVELDALLCVVKSKAGLPSRASISDYCIEVLQVT